MVDLDELDKRIIGKVQEKEMCSAKVNKIAGSLDAPTSTVYTRIKKLEEKGVIKGYTAEINGEKVGKPLTYFSLVKLKYPEDEEDYEFCDRIGKRIAEGHPGIEEVHVMTGEWELLVKIKARDQDEYYEIVKEGIVRRGGGKVIKVNGLAALSTLKEERRIDFQEKK